MAFSHLAMSIDARLNGVREPEPERSSKPCSALRDVDIKRNGLPRLEDCSVSARQRVISCLQGAGQYLGDGDSRHGKTQTPGRMRFEDWFKARTELGMTLEDIDDRSRIDQEERLLRKIIKY